MDLFPSTSVFGSLVIGPLMFQHTRRPIDAVSKAFADVIQESKGMIAL
jgi:hypothetical protein